MRALGVCGRHLGRQEAGDQEQERCRRHVGGVTPPTRLSAATAPYCPHHHHCNCYLSITPATSLQTIDTC